MSTSTACLKNPSWLFYNSVTHRIAPYRGGGERCCSVCASHYRKKLRRKLVDLLEVGAVEFEQGRVRFFSVGLPSLRFDHLQAAWARLRSLLARRYGESVTFIKVAQVGDGGKAHLHGFIDRYVPQRVLSSLWREATHGAAWVVDIREVNMSGRDNVAGYMSRYVSRGDHLPYGVRRYGVSYRLYELLRDRDPRSRQAGWSLMGPPWMGARQESELEALEKQNGRVKPYRGPPG